MSGNDEERKAVCILSFGMAFTRIQKKGATYLFLRADNGGPGTYSQLLIMKEYMHRLGNDLNIAEEDLYLLRFDGRRGIWRVSLNVKSSQIFTKCGYSLIALMLGRLRMTVTDAIDALVTVATTIFPEGSQEVHDPENNSRRLKDAIEDMLQTRGLPLSAKMYERSSSETRCKV